VTRPPLLLLLSVTFEFVWHRWKRWMAALTMRIWRDSNFNHTPLTLWLYGPSSVSKEKSSMFKAEVNFQHFSTLFNISWLL
jgi:uncharacterized membrane protein YccF (DUF307 family)